jgi:NAD(P)-dependent dehydrogenase (short-subunit alcohol dehydrogenase family)
MMLQNKVAVIYGAGGAIAGAATRAFASGGARVFLTGRKRALVEAIAKEIVSAGGSAEAAEVDALDEQAVDKHLQFVIGKAGRVDISLNAIGIPDKEVVGVPLVEMDVKQFSLPITAYTTSYFLTSRFAAKQMIPNKSGVIMTVSALPARMGSRLNGGCSPAQAAKEAPHSRSLRRTCTSGHSRGRSATTWHAGDKHDEGGLRPQGKTVGPNLGTVRRASRQRNPPANGS